MAHFAKIGMKGQVIQVLTLNDSDMLNADDVKDESVGQQYLERHNNWPAQMWIQTSFNTKNNKYYNADGTEHSDQSKAFRGNFAGIGDEWDEDNDMFFPKKPFPSWIKDTTNANWKSPIGNSPDLTTEQQSQNDANTHNWGYDWNEDNQTWDLVDRANIDPLA
jgi:hypothetical protein